jgi:hypothetical protein
MTYHILNGDCLAEQTEQANIQGEVIVCRECLIDGDLTGDTLAQFWETRAKHIAENYDTTTEDYYHKCVREFEKIMKLPEGSEIYLWFENDLFCQANMWFILSLIKNTSSTIYRVFPMISHPSDLWKGFGISSAEMLQQAFEAKIKFTKEDIELGSNLWSAYKTADFKKLKELSEQQSSCFQHLDEVSQAHIDRFPTDKSIGRPEKAVKEIMENTSKDLKIVFAEFSEQQGIYGFGDSQVKNIYDKLSV